MNWTIGCTDCQEPVGKPWWPRGCACDGQLTRAQQQLLALVNGEVGEGLRRCVVCKGTHLPDGTGWKGEWAEIGDPGQLGVECPGANTA